MRIRAWGKRPDKVQLPASRGQQVICEIINSFALDASYEITESRRTEGVRVTYSLPVLFEIISSAPNQAVIFRNTLESTRTTRRTGIV